MSALEVRAYWFEGVDDTGEPGPRARARWFGGDAAVDEQIRKVFGDTVEAALRGELDPWAADPEDRVSLILLLDQFTRNLFRGQARAFAGDATALRHCRSALAEGALEPLSPALRYFLLMPLMHAEDLASQREAVRRYTELRDARGPEPSAFYRGGVDWAVRHARAIEQLGRFPARNDALGRETTAAEAAFLAEHPTGF